MFIDNDAARASLAKSFTRKEEGARIVHEAVHLEEQLHGQAFFMRVPTFSNIADGPSEAPIGSILVSFWGGVGSVQVPRAFVGALPTRSGGRGRFVGSTP